MTISSTFNEINDYFIRLNHNRKKDSNNVEKDYYDIEIGIPNKWIFNYDNDFIETSILIEKEMGKIITISSKNDNISIDDLIAFAKTIIETNKDIEKKEKEYNEKLDIMKTSFEEQIKNLQEDFNKHQISNFENLISNIKNETKKEKTTKKVIITKKIESNESN